MRVELGAIYQDLESQRLSKRRKGEGEDTNPGNGAQIPDTDLHRDCYSSLGLVAHILTWPAEKKRVASVNTTTESALWSGKIWGSE